MKNVEIYTDGACSGNPGVGGWGAVLIYNGNEKELSGVDANTTNNRMELLAAISALNALKEPCSVKLYSDSAYLCNAINEAWIFGWEKSNWKGKSKSEIKNIDLWQQILALMKLHSITFIKVKGHADNVNNNRCDKLATEEIKKFNK